MAAVPFTKQLIFKKCDCVNEQIKKKKHLLDVQDKQPKRWLMRAKEEKIIKHMLSIEATGGILCPI